MNIARTAQTARTATRLDDKLNGLLIVAAIVGIVGMNVSTFEGAALGRNGATAPQVMAKAQAKPAATTVLVASR